MARLGRRSRVKPYIGSVTFYAPAISFIAPSPTIVAAKNKRRSTAKTAIIPQSVTGASPQVRTLLTLNKRVGKSSRTPVIINGLIKYQAAVSPPVAALPNVIQAKTTTRRKRYVVINGIAQTPTVAVSQKSLIISAQNRRRSTAKTIIAQPSVTGAPPQVRALITLTRIKAQRSRTPIITNGLIQYQVISVPPVAAKPLILQSKLGARGKAKRPLITGLIQYSPTTPPVAAKAAIIQAKPRPRTQYRQIGLGLYPYQPVSAPVAANPIIYQAKQEPKPKYRRYQSGLIQYQQPIPPIPPVPGPPIPLPTRSATSGSLLPESIMPPNIPIGTVLSNGKVQLDHNWYLLFYNLSIKTLGSPNPAQSITIGSSPFSFVANEPGNVLVNGGTVSQIQIVRQMATVTIPQTSGLFPLSKSDQIIVSYTVAPTLTFMPS